MNDYSLKQLIPLSNNISAMILEKEGASNTTAFDAVSQGWEVYRALLVDPDDPVDSERVEYYTIDPLGMEQIATSREILCVPNYLCPDCGNRATPSICNVENKDIILYKCPVCRTCMTFYLSDPCRRFYERRVRI